MNIQRNNNKRIAKNTLFLYFRMLFTMGIGLYTSRVILNTLGVEDFGIYNVVGGVVTMFSFLNSAMAIATQRFFNFEMGVGNLKGLQEIFCISVNIHAGISIIILLLAETVGLWFFYTYMTIPLERLDAAVWVYQFAVLSAIILIMSAPYNAAIIAHEKMGAFAYISILEVILKLIVVYILVAFKYDKLKLYAILMFNIQFLMRLIYGIYCKRNFQETTYHWHWNKKKVKEMVTFASWSLFGDIAYVTYTQGINILLNIFFTPVVNAARGISVQVQSAIKGFCLNFQMALNPQIIKSYATKDLEYMHMLIFRSSKFSFFLLLFLSLPIFIETEAILIWWLSVVPEHTTEFVRIILCTTVLESIANPLVASAQATGKIKKYQSIIGGTMLLIVPISYVALKMGAVPEIVFIIHFIVSVIAQIIRIMLMRSLISFTVKEYMENVLLPLAKVSLLSIVIPAIASFYVPQNMVGFMIICIICFISVGGIVYKVGLKKTERVFCEKHVAFFFHKLTNKK